LQIVQLWLYNLLFSCYLFSWNISVSESKNYYLQVIQAFCRPLARICLKRGIGLQEIVEQLKLALINQAVRELEQHNRAVNISRLSAATGVHRKDVVRLYREGTVRESNNRFITRVIGQWRLSPDFSTSSGNPRVLSYGDQHSDFSRLVESVSRDLHPGTVFFELERAKLIKRTPRGVRLLTRGYVPHHDFEQGIDIMADDIQDLSSAVIENLESPHGSREHYHGRTHFDNVSTEDLPTIRSWLIKESARFQTRVARFIAKFDLDIATQKKKKGGSKVTLGVFSYSTPPDDIDHDTQNHSPG